MAQYYPRATGALRAIGATGIAGRASFWSARGLLLLCLLGCAFLSCISFSREAPDQRYYVLRIDRKGVKRETSYPDILRLLPFDISPAYAGRHFVYRRSDVRFETDFYNRFLLAPATNIAEETRRWLAESGLFQAVVKRSAAEKPACYLLEASIDALYIDRSEEASQAVAVLEVEFLLAKLSGQRQLYRRYSQTAPAKGEAPEDLFRAYRQALRQVLQLLEHDLAEQPEKRGCSR